MRLNPDCIRDLVLTREEKCDFENQWTYDKNMPLEDRLEKYTRAVSITVKVVMSLFTNFIYKALALLEQGLLSCVSQ